MQKQNHFDINMNSNQLEKFTNNSRVCHLIRYEMHSVKFLQRDRIVGERVALQLNETHFSIMYSPASQYWFTISQFLIQNKAAHNFSLLFPLFSHRLSHSFQCLKKM